LRIAVHLVGHRLAPSGYPVGIGGLQAHPTILPSVVPAPSRVSILLMSVVLWPGLSEKQEEKNKYQKAKTEK